MDFNSYSLIDPTGNNRFQLWHIYKIQCRLQFYIKMKFVKKTAFVAYPKVQLNRGGFHCLFPE